MEVRDYITGNAGGFFDGLKEWLAIPSISADPAHHGDVRASAEWLAGHPARPGVKTIVPREAHAKVSFRLVAHQEPAEVAAALREYVAAHAPPGIDAAVTFGGPGVRPSFADLDSAPVRAARRAMERSLGKGVLFTREGGSGPEADLADILGAPLVFVAVGLDEDRTHAPNEKVEMALLLKGAEAAAYLWDELSAGRT
jgi:acetylornithine deacetylase/succinyl-diaminopimelate desuccinylase-like protein